MAYLPSHELVDGVLSGDARSIARMLTRAENGADEARTALDSLYARAGRAHVVGVTGVPGSGKSTLVAKLAAAIRRSGRTVAIVAVDPSSPYSGGAILGDRIRMADLAGDPGVWVRSMATRGALGGLARGTLESVDVLDAAGYDIVIIETVGVGQDEVDVARAAHTTVVVSAPGLGDDIQAIKAGILEIADIHVVSKCDRPDANRTVADLKSMMALAASLSEKPLWQVPILPTSSERGEGIAELRDAIDRHRAMQRSSAAGEARARHIARYRTLKTVEELLRRRFAAARNERLDGMVQQIARRELDPFAAAETLLGHIP